MKKIYIGKYEFEVKKIENPIDGFFYVIETTGNQSSKSPTQKFYPIRFSEVTGETFPNDLDFWIYDAKSKFRHVSSIWIQKKENKCEIKNNISLFHNTWDMSESLNSFTERFVNKLRTEKTISSVSIDKNEYGIDVVSTTEVDASDDIYLRICSFEELQEKIFRKLMIPNNKEVSPKKYGDQRLHWWIRYVIVPLVGSGAIATVIAKFLLKA